MVSATYNPADDMYLTLRWSASKAEWWFFTRKYDNHIIVATISDIYEYQGYLLYQSRDFDTHCHGGEWCVTHDDPQNPDITVWFKGYNYRFLESEYCSVGGRDYCHEYRVHIDKDKA
jgi:hypothetical protein